MKLIGDGVDFPATVQAFADGFTVHRLDDGADYWSILKDFEAGLIPYEREFGKGNRRTYIINVDDRQLVVKYDSRPTDHLDSRIIRSIRGPVFRSLMKRSNEAIRRGCDIIPRIFLVAEKMAGAIAAESVMIAEYIVGRVLADETDKASYKGEIKRVLEKLHSFDLAHVDAHHGNFIVTEQGLKLIDLSCRDSITVGRARDVLRVKRSMGVHLPCRTLVEKVMMGYVLSSLLLQNFNRWLRGRRAKQFY